MSKRYLRRWLCASCLVGVRILFLDFIGIFLDFFSSGSDFYMEMDWCGSFFWVWKIRVGRVN